MESFEESKQNFLLISAEQLDSLRLELVWYALSKSKRLRWRTESQVELAGGQTIYSVVNDALSKLVTGEREWDSSRVPLRKFLKGVIDSLLSHLVDSPDNIVFKKLSSDELGASASQEAAWLKRGTATPEETLLNAEQQRLDDFALGMLKEECAEDNLLTKIITKIQEGLCKPAELAQSIGCGVADVNNGFKRLDRKCISVGKRMWLAYGVGRNHEQF